ncbi:MAG TPA: efflux RND transporter permease subunit, partial [Thermoanaerobaculia bacterium]|nr:efflux RND transporter permease subunit [Thermoanaerobaculia bacterium]
MSLPRLAVNRPVTAAVLLASVLVFGGLATARLPLAFLPEVDAPFIGIEIPYPDSSPAEVDREITERVEERLATLSGVKTLRSRSDADGAFFELLFDWGQDLDLVRMRVSELMDQVKPELPEGVGDVLIFSFSTSDIPVVEARISAEGVDLSESYELLEARVLNRIRRVPGVARVDLGGVEPKEIDIDLALDKIKAHGVDVSALLDTLRRSSENLVLGEVREGGLRYTARALGGFRSVEELRDLVIDPRGLRLSDVAEVTYEEPPLDYGRHLDGKDAIALTVFKESTANTVDTAQAVMRVIEEDIGGDPLLRGISVFVWDDQAEEILNSLHGLTRSGFLGALLAVVVLYFFLRRLASTLIVSLSIPFSIIAACGVLYFLGKSLNVLSMMGLMLGVGMLVDNAIVVLESIDRRQRTEPDPKQAALGGASQVALAVTASTATSLIVFLPLIVGADNELSVWLGEVGIAICLALACSLFSALTLIPLVSARFLKRREAKAAAKVPLARLEERYVRLLGWTLAHRGRTWALLAGGAVVGFLPFFTGMVESSMFSGTVNERMYLAYEFTDFAYKSDARRAVETVEAHLFERVDDYGVESVYSFFSSSNPTGTTLTFADKGMSDEEFKALRGRIREELPEIPGVRLVFEDQGDGGDGTTSFAVNLYGQDSGVLSQLARETERLLGTVPGVQDVTSPLRESRQEIQVKVDREKAARMGLTARDVADVFSFTLGGMRLPRFDTGEREVDTWVALRLEDRQNLADLARLEFRGEDGRPVLLGDVASFEVVDRPRQIRRENRKGRFAVRATYDGEAWDAARKEIAGHMDAVRMPAGYSWSWSNRILEQDTQGAQMGVNLLLALVLVYLVMASLFESLAQPFAILFSIPFAIPGAAWLLGVTGTPFNLMSQIGILILMGIVVNNGIVLLDQVNRNRAAGLSDREAVLAAGRDRMRPILMTASTTII